MAWLFVMGLGMGSTMMPLFTSALKTLKAHEVARGSTLLNVTQQISSSIGVAAIVGDQRDQTDVLDGSAKLARRRRWLRLKDPAGSHTDKVAARRHADQAGGLAEGLPGSADASRRPTGWPSALVALTLIPVFFLPRKREERTCSTTRR